MEEELDSARHRDAPAERRPKPPAACRLERGAIEGRRHAAGESDAGDVSCRVDLNAHGHVSTRVTRRDVRGIGRLLLLEHGWWLDHRRRRRLRVLRPSDRLNGGQCSDTQREPRPELQSTRERMTNEFDAE